MRLIDADKLGERLREKIYSFIKEWGVGINDLLDYERGRVDEIEKCILMISAAPIIDAVKVVRCKDCKYWHDHITTTWCSRGAELRPQESGWVKRDADDFCSYGEKKDHEF